MKKTFYEKRGSRYVPVCEYDSQLVESYPKGTHLVSVHPGGTSRRYDIDPDYAPMIAAGIVAQDAVCAALQKASEMRPAKIPLTERQQKAWQELSDSFGDELSTLHGPSNHEIADAAVKAMIVEADKLLKNQSVRKAYDHFIMVSKLSTD